jgi:hypothetical protein
MDRQYAKRGKTQQQSFSAKKYGAEKAFEMAVGGPCTMLEDVKRHHVMSPAAKAKLNQET